MKSFALVCCAGLLALGSLSAQESSKFSFSLGAGFTTPLGSTANQLDEAWNIQGGAGYNFSKNVGLNIDLGYNSFGINSTTLASFGTPGGDVHIFSATLNPIFHVTPHSHADVYVTGGGGLYHSYQEFTAPSIQVAPVFNPFFGFYPAAFQVNQVLSSYSVNKPGIDAGVGVAFGTKWHGKIFAEARYNRMFMTNGYHADYIPVTFGFRW